MANDRTTNQSRNAGSTQANAAQSTSPSGGTQAGGTQGRTTDRADAHDQRSDRERSIQTGRETHGETRSGEGRSGGMTRRGTTAPMYGGSMYSPFMTMRRMAEDMDRLFESLGFGRGGFGLSPVSNAGTSDLWNDNSSREQALWSPQVETFRRGDKLVVRADLPGMKKDDVHVEVNDGVLAISGERCEENEDNRDDFYRSERSYGRFYRAIPLPEGADENECEASFNDGVLEVTLSAPKERTARRIPIR